MVVLRPLEEGDLDEVFAWESDPRAVRMAAFTRADPSDRAAFDAHRERIRSDPTALVRAVEADGALVGTVGSFDLEGERNVTYQIAPARWGEGLASAALAALLAIEATRPIFGRVAEHNVGSATVLARNGFVEVATERAYAAGLGTEVTERIYRLG